MLNNSSSQRGFGLITVLILVGVAALLAGGGVFWWQKLSNLPQVTVEVTTTPSPSTVVMESPIIVASATPTVAPTPLPSPQATTGTITGTLSYPSEGLPKDMKVCAQNVQTQQTTCMPNYAVGQTYALEVPLGTYHVYAFVASNPGYKAYYNKFVTCGLLASCPDHTAINVDVKAGQTVPNINPHDWYNQ